MNIQAFSLLAGELDGLLPSHQAVLWQLAAHTQGKGYVASIGQEAIARKTGMGVRSVNRAISELRKAGIIEPAGWSYEYKVRKWRICLHATDGVSGDNPHATCDNPHATGDRSHATRGVHTKRTKRTNAETAPPLEGGSPIRDLIKKHGGLLE